MRVKVLDIHPDDAYYDDRDAFIGQIAEVGSLRGYWKFPFVSASLTFDDKGILERYDQEAWYNFLAVKLDEDFELSLWQRIKKIIVRFWRQLWEH